MNEKEKMLSIEELQESFGQLDYICSKKIATTLFLAYKLNKPVLVEGPAGVGKTELAKTCAKYLESPLIRLQCYEGLDESKSLYEWKYGKQLLYTQILKDNLNKIIDGRESLADAMEQMHKHDDLFFSMNFLEPRPLLKALQTEKGSVLLIDEIDKSDEEFEAFLLEVLSDFQVSVPEIGTITAKKLPFVILTSNNARDLSDALKRRCLHLYIPFPGAKMERDIVRVKVPGISEELNKQLVSFIQQIRALDIKKLPSISETIDWARVLMLLCEDNLGHNIIKDTLNVILKYEEDIRKVELKLNEMAMIAKQED
ncbi:MAG TPA: ATPase [Clostridiales bacterium]|jgi:MoxR-like ATPase|nr:ATPase [Clostridiales bacterium]